MNKSIFNKQKVIDVVKTTYEKTKVKLNAYTLGKEVALLKGKEYVKSMQNALSIVGLHISDLLVELFYPHIDEEHEIYEEIRKKCFGEFVSGAVSQLNNLNK